MTPNLPRCHMCGCSIIAEELDNHQCRKRVIDYKIERNILWLSDGENWYPRKLLSKSPTRNEQQNRTTKDETEPIILIKIGFLYMIFIYIGFM